MKHFKLNTERNLVPVADLCIADVAKIVIEDQMLVAKK